MTWLLTSPGHQQPWYWLYREYVGPSLTWWRILSTCVISMCMNDTKWLRQSHTYLSLSIPCTYMTAFGSDSCKEPGHLQQMTWSLEYSIRASVSEGLLKNHGLLAAHAYMIVVPGVQWVNHCEQHPAHDKFASAALGSTAANHTETGL